MKKIGAQQTFIEEMKVQKNINHFGSMVKGSCASPGYLKNTSVF